MGNHYNRSVVVKPSIVLRWAGSPQPAGTRSEDDGSHICTGNPSQWIESGNGLPAPPEFLFATFCNQSSNSRSS